MKPEQVKIAAVKLNPANPRTIKDEKFAQLVRSVRDFPQMLELRPIIVNDKMEVLGGNMRLRACIEAGMETVWIIRASDLTEEQQREFIIKDNVGFGEWDYEALANEWDAGELADWGLDIPDFSVGGNAEAHEDEYEMPDDIKTDIVIGDLFDIGPHRLLCGDSTIADDVQKVLNGDKPRLMVTDPPYGVEYDPEWRLEAGVTKNKSKKMGKVKNDERADWTETWALCSCEVAYIWHAGRHAKTVQESIEKCEFEIRNQIIWVKDRFALSRGNYHWQHEPCWYAVRKGKKAAWVGDRSQSTIWQIPSRDDSGHGHGTQKPVECMARPIKNHEGDVYDPFIGSGTTMVAAHQLNRKCYGMEIDPKYCQVIIDRMLKLDPGLRIKKNGKEYTPAEQMQPEGALV